MLTTAYGREADEVQKLNKVIGKYADQVDKRNKAIEEGLRNLKDKQDILDK